MPIMKWRSVSSIVQEGGLPAETVVIYGMQIAQHIHDRHLHSGMIADLQLADFYVQPHGGLKRSAGAFRTFAYRAPEQFGPAGRWPDERSDLYALGVMLYEMWTGRLPMEPKEGQSWEEMHLLRPLRPFPTNADAALCAIITKALAASPQNRYQTAYGMLMDMGLCKEKRSVNAAELFHYDRRSRLRRPEGLLGRAVEWAALQQYAEVYRSGGRQALLVCGPAGVGKSRLLSEWKRQLLLAGELAARVEAGAPRSDASGLSASEQISVVLQAEEQWEQQWLCKEPEPGPQGAWLEARLQQPFILMVDVARGADDAAVNEAAMNEACRWLEQQEQEASRLLVAACADDVQRERLLDRLQAAGVSVSLLEMPPLEYGAVLEWITDVLQETTSRARVWAGAVQQWSGGLPGEIVACLERWHAEGSLSYSYERHCWTWAEELVTGAPLSDSYVQSMERVLTQLPRSLQEPLERAALIGMRFSMSILAELLEQDHTGEGLRGAVLHELLSEAERLGLICQDEAEGDNWLFLSAFVQDRLYRQTSQAQRSALHCRVGELYDRRGAASGEENGGELARRHLNLGAEQLSPARRRELAARNYAAGWQASRNGGLVRAIHAMEQALQLAWDGEGEPDELACKSGYELYTLLHYQGEVDRALSGLAWIREHMDKLAPPERLDAYLRQQDIFSVQDPALALAISRDALAAFDWQLPERVSPLRAVLEAVKTVRAARKIDKQDDQIIENQQLTYVAQCQLLLGQIFPLSASDPAMLLYTFAQLVRRGLSLGRNEYFLNALDAFEMLLQRGLPGLYRLWPKHLRTVWGSGLRARAVQQSKLLFMNGMLSQLEQPAQMQSSMERVLRQSREQRQVTLFNLTAVTYMITAWGTARQLGDTVAYLEQEAVSMLDETALRILQLMKLYLRACNEDGAWQRYASPAGWELDGIAPDHVDYMLRAEQAYVYGNYEDTLHFARLALETELEMDWIRNRRVRLLEALARTALYAAGAGQERRRQARAIRHRLKQISRWQGFLGCGSSAYWLLRAEWAVANQNHRAALQAYEQAAGAAKQEMANIFQPLSLERMALCYREQGLTTGSLVTLVEAMSAYVSCGYTAKGRQLEREHPELAAMLHPRSSGREAERQQSERPAGTGNREQRPLQEMPPSVLQEDELLAAACRQAGANHGLLLELAGGEHPRVLASYGLGDEGGGWAHSVVRAAWARKGIVVLQDAQQSEFLADPHIASGKAASVLSLPARLPVSPYPAALYLEHTQIVGLFNRTIAEDIETLVRSFTYRSLLEQPDSVVWRGRLAPNDGAGQEMHTVLAEPLSERETEVLQAIVAGHSNREIAELLHITEATVKSHAHHVYGKLGVKRRGQAISRARELNLTEWTK